MAGSLVTSRAESAETSPQAGDPPAAVPEEATTAADSSSRDSVKERELEETPFDTELTGTSAAGTRSFSGRPRAGDLVDNPYVRLRLRARYGLTDHLELFCTFEGYLDNPAQSPSEWGINRFEPGLKWQWSHPPESMWRLALGGSWELPLGRPPEDIQDGYARVRPFVVVTRPDPQWPDFLPYLNIAGEIVHKPLGRRLPPHSQPRHRLTLQPGVLWNPPGPWRGVIEARWRTDVIDGGGKHEVSLRPGLAREVPQPWLATFRLRGSAELGLDFDVPIHGKAGLGTGVSARYQFGGNR